MDLKVTQVEYLQTVKDRAIDRVTFILDATVLNAQMVQELSELIDESPGQTKIFFQLATPGGKQQVLLRSSRRTVDLKPSLLQYVEQQEGMNYRIN